jgi:hypothetical protein
MKNVAAVSKIKGIQKDLEKLIEDISIQDNAQFLLDPLRPLWTEFDNNALKVDILFLETDIDYTKFNCLIPESCTEDFQSFEKQGIVNVESANINYRIFDQKHIPGKSSGKIPILIKVLVVGDTLEEGLDLDYLAQRFSKETAVLFVACSDKPTTANIKTLVSRLVWKMVPITDLNGLSSELEKIAEHRELFNLAGISISTQKLVTALDSVIDNEQKDLNSRRVLIQNDHLKLKKMGVQRLEQDVFSILKVNLQRSFSEFENGINGRFNRLTKNQPGSLYSFVMDQIDDIQGLEEVNVDRATTYTISKRTLKKIEEQARDGFTEHLTQDANALNEFLTLSIEEINAACIENGMADFSCQVKMIQAMEVSEELEEQFHFEKGHDPKPLKKGFMAFFSAVRQPYMIIIMLVGLVSKFMEKLNLWEQTWFKLLMFVSLVGGVFFAIRSGKKKKRETELEELKKVSQWLKMEYKRIFTNIERDWKLKYFNHAKNEFAEILRKAESDLKHSQTTRMETVSTETAAAQRKMQNIDSFDKKVKESIRQKLKLESDLSSLNADLKQGFLKLEV